MAAQAQEERVWIRLYEDGIERKQQQSRPHPIPDEFTFQPEIGEYAAEMYFEDEVQRRASEPQHIQHPTMHASNACTARTTSMFLDWLCAASSLRRGGGFTVTDVVVPRLNCQQVITHTTHTCNTMVCTDTSWKIISVMHPRCFAWLLLQAMVVQTQWA